MQPPAIGRAACFRSRLDANRLLILAPDFGDARLPSALMGLRQDPVRPALQLELSGHLGFLRLRERRYRFVSGVTMRVPGRHIVDARAASILNTVFGRNPKVFTVLFRFHRRSRRAAALLLP